MALTELMTPDHYLWLRKSFEIKEDLEVSRKSSLRLLMFPFCHLFISIPSFLHSHSSISSFPFLHFLIPISPFLHSYSTISSFLFSIFLLQEFVQTTFHTYSEIISFTQLYSYDWSFLKLQHN